MATKRVVIVASPASNVAKKYETTASTWGEFKDEISDIYTASLEAIVNPGNTTLVREDAVLPTGDFRLFLVPTKNKAGNMTPSQAQSLAKEIGDAIVEGARKASNEEVDDLRNRLIGEIEEFFSVNLSDDDCPECDEALAAARAFMP